MNGLHTIGDLIRAANGAQDIQRLGLGFLMLWREHCNGCCGITVTRDEFAVTVVGVEKQSDQDSPRIQFAMTWQSYGTWQSPTYYSPEDENYTEGFGGDNVSGYVTCGKLSKHGLVVNIPTALLMMPRDSLVAHMKAIKAKDVADREERKRQEQILIHRKALAKLEGT